MKSIINLLKYGVTYTKSGTMRVSQPIIYKVISTTEQYPKFIPFIKSAAIFKKISDHQNLTRLSISYSSFDELSYLSHVRLKPAIKFGDVSEIHSFCNDDPLKKLTSIWQIQGIEQHSAKVNYTIDFQFASPLYQVTSAFLIDHMGEKLWQCFEKQAQMQQKKLKNEADIKKPASSSPPQQKQPSQKQPINPQQCRISRLSQYLNQNPQLKAIYMQSTANQAKIQKYHYTFESLPGYQAQMKIKIKSLVGANVENTVQ